MSGTWRLVRPVDLGRRSRGDAHNLSEVVTVRLSPTDVLGLNQVAQLDRCEVSVIVRGLIRDHVRRRLGGGS